MKQTVADIARRLAQANEEEYAVWERALVADPRKGVKQALARARRRLDAQAAEAERTDHLYRFQREAALAVVSRQGAAPSEAAVGAPDTADAVPAAAAGAASAGGDAALASPVADGAPDGAAVSSGAQASGRRAADGAQQDSWVCAVGLDEVGRGPLAGPLAVGAVVLPETPQIIGLNDSKQLTPAHREQLDKQIRATALAWDIEYIEPAQIDEDGMTACLKTAFSRAVAAIDEQLPAGGDGDGPVQAVLLDGSPLHIDARELSLVKGDARVAAIAAASIIAKVARDRLMVEYGKRYPAYDFASNKGYGSAEHIAAIERYGLSPIHRKSFCRNFPQETLF